MGFGLPAELTTTTGLLTFLRLYAQAGAQTPEPVHLSPRDRGQPEPRLWTMKTAATAVTTGY